MAPADAVVYGVEALGGATAGMSSHPTLARSMAAAFANGATIDDLVQDGQTLKTANLVAEFKAFIAREVRRIAVERRVRGSDLCDVSERSLRELGPSCTPAAAESFRPAERFFRKSRNNRLAPASHRLAMVLRNPRFC